MKLNFFAIVMIFALLLAQPVQARRHGGGNGGGGATHQAGVFDYYALSLSWAPNYCASHADDQNECGAGRNFGFVLHGLWPQYEKGWPQDCSDDPIPGQVAQRFAALYPSPKLMQHEWAKHGTCSGLDPQGYFTLSGRLKEGVKIPAAYQQPKTAFSSDSVALAKAFLEANSQLQPGSVVAVCSGKFLSEIHLCFDRAGASRACSAAETSYAAKRCGSAFLVRSIR